MRQNLLWLILTVFLTAIIVMPLSVIFLSFTEGFSNIWHYLAETVLYEIGLNTLWLVLGVAGATFILGVSLAGLVTFCDFSGRKHAEWLLVLPLAIPTYVVGFVWIGLLDYSAAFPTLLRELLHFNLLDVFPIRSRAGVICVMSLALYPYVYLLARNSFRSQGRSIWEAAITLGYKPWKVFLRVALPMARPWIMAGIMLVGMETLADFGTVSVFNYDTFTTAIYKAWFGLFSLSAARQLACILLFLVSCMALIDHFIKGKQNKYVNNNPKKTLVEPIVLKGTRNISASLYVFLVIGLAFIIPVVRLLIWALANVTEEWSQAYWGLLTNSVLLSTAAAFIIGIATIVFAYTDQIHKTPLAHLCTRIATLGYAVPGTVLAIGIFTVFALFDQMTTGILRFLFSIELKTFLVGTVIAMLLGYAIRFFAVSFHPIQNAFLRVNQRLQDVGDNLGVKGTAFLRRVYLPMLRGGIATGFLFVFVEVMKEMPITLMTRPFGWNTLSVRIFEMISEGQWERAALPAVMLVAVGTIPVFMLIYQHKAITRKQEK